MVAKLTSGGAATAGFLAHGVILLLPVAALAAAGVEVRLWRPLLLVALLSAAAATEAALVARFRLGDSMRFAEPQARREMLASGVLLVALWLAVAQSAVASHGRPTDLVVLGGIVLITAGTVLRALAMLALCGGFAREGAPYPTRLVTDGLYAVLRHPSETGLVFLVIGTALVSSSLAALALYVTIGVPLTRFRLRAEEEKLQSCFAGYTAYQARTGGLIPKARSMIPRRRSPG